jgi:hypothetical protein
MTRAYRDAKMGKKWASPSRALVPQRFPGSEGNKNPLREEGGDRGQVSRFPSSGSGVRTTRPRLLGDASGGLEALPTPCPFGQQLGAIACNARPPRSRGFLAFFCKSMQVGGRCGDF